MSKLRLLNLEEVEEYGLQIESYHPNGQIVYDFALSNFAVIAGPTGAGKDTLRNGLLQDTAFVKILSTTSRPPRPGEEEGVQYHFRPLDFFDEGIEDRRFLQIALVHKQQLSCLDFRDLMELSMGQIGLAILVVQTEIGLRKLNPDLKTIFLVPPSLSELLTRMKKDRLVADDELAHRVEAVSSEIQVALKQPSYYCIVNDQIERAKNLASQFLKSSQIDKDEDTRAREVMKQILLELGQ